MAKTKRDEADGSTPKQKSSAAPSGKAEPTPEEQAKIAREAQAKKDRESGALEGIPTTPEEAARQEADALEADRVAEGEARSEEIRGLNSDIEGGSFDPRFKYAYSITQDVGNNMNQLNGKPTPKKWRGAPAVFNMYALHRFDLQMPYNTSGNNDSNLKYFDRAEHPNDQKSSIEGAPTISWKNPRASDIIEWSKQPGREAIPYEWSDFLYCKYYSLIPNNYLLTLRRYPAPVLDNNLVGGPRKRDEKDKYVLPAAQAITWMGEETGNKLSEFFSFDTGINWRKLEAEVNQVEGNEVGGDSMGHPSLTKMNNMLSILNGKANFGSISGQAEQQAKHDPYNNGPYSNRVYGPVNAITETMARARGLTFKNSFSLNFHYSQDSIGALNPKITMIDALSNILALVYNNAAFWGGANRYFPNVPQYPFFSGAAQSAWFSGNPGGFMDAIGTEVKKAMRNIADWFTGIDFQDPNSIMKALGNFAEGAAKLGMAHLQAGHRPNIVAMRALLTGEAVGEWHLTIGNPLNPIAKIGNLIVTGAKFEFSDQLGADDFPIEFKAIITLEHGKPRDAGDIQSMFNNGNGRTYFPYNAKTEPWNTSSSTKNSKIDTSWGKGHYIDRQTRDSALKRKDRDARGYVPFDANESDMEYLPSSLDIREDNVIDHNDFIGRRIYGKSGVNGDALAAIELAQKMSLRETDEVDGPMDIRPSKKTETAR